MSCGVVYIVQTHCAAWSTVDCLLCVPRCMEEAPCGARLRTPYLELVRALTAGVWVLTHRENSSVVGGGGGCWRLGHVWALATTANLHKYKNRYHEYYCAELFLFELLQPTRNVTMAQARYACSLQHSNCLVYTIYILI